jgi:hypothetical protein
MIVAPKQPGDNKTVSRLSKLSAPRATLLQLRSCVILVLMSTSEWEE